MSSSNVICLSKSLHSLKHLFTKIRDTNTTKVDFVRYSNRLMHILCEEGLSYINNTSKIITTPTNCTYHGEEVNTNNIVVISIIRAGDSLLDCFLKIVPEAQVGKILIQRDEATAEPMLFYNKLPTSIETNKMIVLVDPMLATGGSAKKAIEILIDKGVLIENIVFLNVVSCPEGIDMLITSFPNLRIITAEIDVQLNEKAYIIPGLGDFGDRYFGTN